MLCNVRKCETVFCYENGTFKKKNELPPTVLILENKLMRTFLVLVMLKKMVEIVYLITVALVIGRVSELLIF